MPKSNNQEEREASSIMDGRVLVAAHSYVGATMVHPVELGSPTTSVVLPAGRWCPEEALIVEIGIQILQHTSQQIKTCICRNALTSHHKFLCKRKVVTCYQAWELTKLTSYPLF
ncbi:unnamed protein product, partial [Sphagnum jensenii]